MIDLARARLDLHTLLADMEALRPFVDPNSQDREPFNAAWRALLVRAEEAAIRFREALAEALPATPGAYDRFVIPSEPGSISYAIANARAHAVKL